MKTAIKLLAIIAIIAVIGFSLAACDDGNTGGGGGGGGGGGSGATPVTFSSLTAYSSTTTTTTTLTLTFSAAITGLSANDITLSDVAGVTNGALSGAGPTYTLGISGFTANGTLTVAVAKTGYTISGSPKTVTISYESIPVYNLGAEGPGGGKIFYKSDTGFTVQMVNPAENYTAHYLEAAPVDMTATQWATQNETSTNIAGTATEIGTGRKNTALILATLNTNAPAAKACDDYSNGGKTDWFLPSKDELNQLYVNKTSVGNISEITSYWSSSQYSNNQAWHQRFSDGYLDELYNGKNSWISVRAVRAF
ncbi:MAG: DUF1566 domain-containing protein [Treponema sp.]|jgi:hypothetical protein|nr:DUF1566 domain-containing protein [Treponema sp.]